jgi:NADPH-dependent curcumin reductase CurA
VTPVRHAVSTADLVRGLDQFPHALLELFTGENHGKRMLELPA